MIRKIYKTPLADMLSHDDSLSLKIIDEEHIVFLTVPCHAVLEVIPRTVRQAVMHSSQKELRPILFTEALTFRKYERFNKSAYNTE